jgi:hypothetical protein
MADVAFASITKQHDTGDRLDHHRVPLDDNTTRLETAARIATANSDGTSYY